MTDSRPDSQSITVFLLDDRWMSGGNCVNCWELSPIYGWSAMRARPPALTQIRALHPDVAILDVRLPDSDGIAVCREIRAQMPDTACLMLTAYHDDRAGREAVRAGCAGYMLKNIRSASLPSAVRRVASGQPVLGPGRDDQPVAAYPARGRATERAGGPAGRSGSGRARRWSGTARHRGTPPARTRPVMPGPVGPQVGAGLVGTATVSAPWPVLPRRCLPGTRPSCPIRGGSCAVGSAFAAVRSTTPHPTKPTAAITAIRVSMRNAGVLESSRWAPYQKARKATIRQLTDPMAAFRTGWVRAVRFGARAG